MTELYNLREKRERLRKISVMSMVGRGMELDYSEEIINKIIQEIEFQDKEFIELLKRRYCCQTYIGKYCNRCNDCNFINKLAGTKSTQSEVKK